MSTAPTTTTNTVATPAAKAGIALTVTVDAKDAQALLKSLKLGPSDRINLHKRVAARGEELTRTYLREISRSRHSTADRLGARPTGFWGDAVERVTRRASADGAQVGITHPGVGRAMHDVTIKPKNASKYLTIPVNAIGYGRRAREIGGLFFFTSKKTGKKYLGLTAEGVNHPIAIYLLVESQIIKQDRTLLPSDDAYGEAAAAGTRDWVDAELAKVKTGGTR